LLNTSQIRETLRRQGGLDLAKEFVQGFIEDRVFEDTEDVPVEVETHQLRDGEGDGKLKPVAFDKAPAALVATHFGVERKPCFLDGSEISPDGTRGAVFLCGKLSHSGTLLFGLNGPQDAPLPG